MCSCIMYIEILNLISKWSIINQQKTNIYRKVHTKEGTIRYSFSLTELSTDEAESHILRLAALLEVVGHWSQLPHGGDGPFIVD